MIKKETFVPIQFFKKEPYAGSMKGMRYRLNKEEGGLEVAVYPEPYCYEATPEEQKTKEIFPFTEEGRVQAIDWINQQYEEKKEIWELARRK